jgi:hypothetical protein
MPYTVAIMCRGEWTSCLSPSWSARTAPPASAHPQPFVSVETCSQAVHSQDFPRRPRAANRSQMGSPLGFTLRTWPGIPLLSAPAASRTFLRDDHGHSSASHHQRSNGMKDASRKITPLQSALAKNSFVTPLESALTNSLHFKSFRIRTYEKRGGRGPASPLPPSFPRGMQGTDHGARNTRHGKRIANPAVRDSIPNEAF